MKLIREVNEGWRVLTDAQAEKLGGAAWGGRVGTLDDTTYAELVAKLGQPTKKAEPRDLMQHNTKSAASWVILGDDGTICRIYDYKQSSLYDGEDELDLADLHDDPSVQQELSKRTDTDVAKLGLTNVTSWSIGGGPNDIDREQHMRKDSEWAKTMTPGAAVELAKKIFGERAVHSLYDKTFRELFGRR